MSGGRAEALAVLERRAQRARGLADLHLPAGRAVAGEEQDPLCAPVGPSVVVAACPHPELGETVFVDVPQRRDRAAEPIPVAQVTESPAEEVAPNEMTCAEVSEALQDQEREEEASYLVVWAYGVRTGVEGLDYEKYPVNREGLEAFVTRVTLACKADPSKLFVDAILE